MSPAAETQVLSLSDVVGQALPPAVDRYEVRGLLGKGGMGAVFLGYDAKLGREVAIKVIHKEREGDADVRARFHREAKAIARLHHPNIVEVLDYSGPGSISMFLVMERLFGQTLEAHVVEAPFDELTGAAVAYELADALAHAHEQGIVHRDLKPENIFIEPSGRVVLTDFGIAKAFISGNDGATFAARPTRALGTPLFASYEQLMAPNTVGPTSDLYALGSVLYYLVSICVPYESASLGELLRMLNGGQFRPLSDVVEVSPAMVGVVHKLLQRQQSDRFQSARELQAALRPILQKHGVFDLRAVLRDFVAKVPLAPRPVTQIVSLGALRSSSDLEEAKTQLHRVARGRPSEATVVGTGPAHAIAENTRVAEKTNVATAPSVRVTQPTVTGLSRTWLWIIIAAVFVVTFVVVGLMSTPAPPAPSLVVRPSSVVAVAVEPTPSLAPASLPTPEPTPSAAVTQTLVRFVVRPWGTVTIDGEARGNTPGFREVSLPPGVHTVSVTHPNLGKIDVTLPIDSLADRTVEVDLKAQTSTVR